jgi:hypothetical protein
MSKKRTLRFFDDEPAVLTYLTRELLDTLRDDLNKMKGEERQHYTSADRKEMQAKIADIESIEDRVVLKEHPKPSQSLCILRSFIMAFPEMNDEDAPLAGSEAVERLCTYWPDLTRAVAEDEQRESSDKTLTRFIDLVAGMKTDEEYGEDGMSGDDAVESLSGLVRQARTLQKGRKS